ncbi:MAG: alpha/beta fold hydrolase [Bacteroidetes bacterium]|nr:alpha/beta fold hydrolase [Bacteroidota bacterium]
MDQFSIPAGALMLFRRSIYVLLIALILLMAVSILPAQPSVRTDSLYAHSTRGWIRYTILLPEGYGLRKERFPVLYLLHGFNQDHASWFVSSELIRYAAAHRMIIISSGFGNSWYTNSAAEPHRRYEDAFVRELIPHIDSVYRTRGIREARALAGLSMGGYGALKFGIKYPHLFALAAALSPSMQFPAGLEDSAIVARRSAASNASVRAAFGAARTPAWDDQIIPILVERSTQTLPYIYLTAGSSDNIPEVPEQMHQLAALLRKKRIPFEMHELPGGHDWRFWDAGIEQVLDIFSRRMR